MIEVISCISALFLILKINKDILSYQYKLLNPITVICVTWILVYICHYSYWGTETNGNMYILTTVALIFLVVGFWLSIHRNMEHKRDNHIKITYNNRNLLILLKFLILLELIKLFFSIYIVIFVLSEGNWLHFFIDSTEIRILYLSRTSSLFETIFSFFGSLLGYLGYIILALYCSLGLKKKWYYFTIISIIELLLALVTMSKFSFIIYILTFIVAYLNQLPSIKTQLKIVKKVFPIIIVFLFLFFMLIGLQRNYAETKGGLEEGVINGIISYFGGPFEAFAQIINRKIDISKYEYGMIDIGLSYVNVYTWFYYFSSITYLGIFILPFIIGFISGWVYRPWKRNIFFDVVNTYISVIFAMSFFDLLLKFTVFPVLFIFTAFINTYCKKIFYQKQKTINNRSYE